MRVRVKPTMQAKGVSINDDAGLEREADVMGAKALQMKRAKEATTGSNQQGALSLRREGESKGELEGPGVAIGASGGKGRLNFLSVLTAKTMRATPRPHAIVGKEIAASDRRTSGAGKSSQSVSSHSGWYNFAFGGGFRETPSTTRAACTLIQRQEDWDFTPSEYGRLRTGGGDLRFSADSSWFPRPFQENLAATLRHVMNPRGSLQRGAVTATEGVNVRDFYHGHVVIPHSAFPGGNSRIDHALPTQGELWRRQRRHYRADTRFGLQYGRQRARGATSTPRALSRAIRRQSRSAGRLLGAVVRNWRTQAAVIYHTREFVRDELLSGDPMRNYLTPLDTNQPRRYLPRDPHDATSYTQEFVQILQFAFLVDEHGVVHVRPGSAPQLSDVTGEVMPPLPSIR
jgi:hypothetical protein